MNATSPPHGVGIAGTGHYVPDRVVTNQELVDLGLETSDEWIQTKIGIRERRFLGEGECSSSLGARAVLRALENANLAPEDVDLVVAASVTQDDPLSSVAMGIQERVGLPNAFCFDVNAACAGFVFALETAAGFIKDGSARTAVVVGADSFSTILDFQDRSTCVFFGDGAGAMVLRRVPAEENQLLSFWLETDGSQALCVTVPAGRNEEPITAEALAASRHTFKMDGKAVFRFATDSGPDAAERALARMELSPADLSFVITHQANVNIIRQVVSHLGMRWDQTYTDVDRYGNTSGASPIMAIDEAHRRGAIPEGKLLAVVAFGAGLAWGASILRWRVRPC